jgi:heptosyltransferase-2
LIASVVLQTSFLGDMILTTPLLARLAAEGPVHVVATPANAGVLRHHPAVASVIVYDKRGVDRGLRGLWRVARAVRSTGARRAFLAQGSMRTAALALLAGIPERIGFATSAGRALYTRRVPYDRSAHHATRLWQLADRPGHATHPSVRPSLVPGDEDVAAVRTVLASHAVEGTTPLVALAPGSVWATKRWPGFAELASQLTGGPDPILPRDARLVVIGGEADAGLARDIADAVHHAGGAPVIDATGRLSLLASAALIARCRAIVTNDSAPLHLASAMNIPTIALFGPTVPTMGFGPLASASHVVGHAALSCRPCHAHGPMACPLGHWRCMREVGSDQVIAPLRRAINL